MHILLYVPDNQVTRNFLPQLWPFVLQQRTPPGHRVTIMDGNAVHSTPAELIRFIKENQVRLVGMGFMTRMAQKAYAVAEAIRENTDAFIVMGGPHVTEVPDEPLGRSGRPRYADAVVLGEADHLWPRVVKDVECGALQPIYQPDMEGGRELKPSLEDYPIVPWDEMDLSLFDLMRFVPQSIRHLLKRMGVGFEKTYVIPIESGRGCPYGCEFCTVTGFFGDSIRFRETGNVISELLRLKAMALKQNALVSVFFVDDNFAINPRRTKALLREMIQHDVCLPWTAQISINLLKDPELVELIELSGARWIFVGLESVDPASLKAARKEFNKPQEYASILENLARHNVYAITSFIYGMDGDTPGVEKQTVETVQNWPPGLPVFGLLTPYPATPLYDRLNTEGRLIRPEHWLDFQAFKSALLPKHISSEEADTAVRYSWNSCYAPASFRRTQRWMLEHGKTFGHQLTLFISRLLFRGIYLPQKSLWAWFKVLACNYWTIGSLIRSGLRTQRQLSCAVRLPRPEAQPSKLDTELSGD
jgi:radical SAM superfamily enzyme YgiQ (UPF0313 family)